MTFTRTLVAAIALGVASITPALAQGTGVANGLFEQGLNGWSAQGDVLVTGTNPTAVLTTASTAYEDDAPMPAGSQNRSGTAAVDFFYAAHLGGVSIDALDAASGNFTFEGSAITQQLQATPGTTLTLGFDWAFNSSDATFADLAFVAIDGNVYKLTDATTVASGQFSRQLTVGATGQVSLAFGVVDVGDASGTSELRLDNIAAVPEPSVYALLLGGLLVLSSLTRRRD
jgi:hypothetical protein